MATNLWLGAIGMIIVLIFMAIRYFVLAISKQRLGNSDIPIIGLIAIVGGFTFIMVALNASDRPQVNRKVLPRTMQTAMERSDFFVETIGRKNNRVFKVLRTWQDPILGLTRVEIVHKPLQRGVRGDRFSALLIYERPLKKGNRVEIARIEWWSAEDWYSDALVIR